MCRLVLNLDCAIKEVSLPRARLLWATVLLAFASWVVSIGSLATLQEACIGDATNGSGGYGTTRGFSSSVLSCAKIYRFYWFIVAFEIVVLLGAALAHSMNVFSKYRVAVIGLMSIATLLYIEMTDAFLTGKDKPRYVADELEDRALSMIAGCIMTATANFFFLLVAGYVDEEAKQM